MVSVFAVLFVTLFRVLPHAPNFAPVGAVAILAGRSLPRRTAILTTVAAVLISDAVLSRIYGYPFLSYISFFVLGAFVLQALLGRALRNQRGGAIGAAVGGACLFFLVTNFGVWLQGTMYPLTWAGLLQCYAMGLPFFKMTLLGTLVWTPILSVAYRLYQTRMEPKARALPAL